MRRAVIAAGLVAAAAVVAPNAAAAEEGLVVARAAGGVASVRSDWRDVDQLWAFGLDQSVSQRAGVLLGVELHARDEAFTLGLGLGLRYLLVERMWNRLYVHAGPQLLVVWPDGADRRWDVAAGGGLGYEHLLVWGLGLVVELHGTAPLGRGPAEPLDGATAGVTAGLFMEF